MPLQYLCYLWQTEETGISTLGRLSCTPSIKQSIPLQGLKGKNNPNSCPCLFSRLFSYRHKTITENETSNYQKSDLNNDYPVRNCDIEHILLGVSVLHCTASLGLIYKHVNKVYGFHWGWAPWLGADLSCHEYGSGFLWGASPQHSSCLCNTETEA